MFYKLPDRPPTLITQCVQWSKKIIMHNGPYNAFANLATLCCALYIPFVVFVFVLSYAPLLTTYRKPTLCIATGRHTQDSNIPTRYFTYVRVSVLRETHFSSFIIQETYAPCVVVVLPSARAYFEERRGRVSIRLLKWMFCGGGNKWWRDSNYSPTLLELPGRQLAVILPELFLGCLGFY